MNRILDSLKRKLGPLPAWAWLAIFAAALIGYRYLTRGRTPGAAGGDAVEPAVSGNGRRGAGDYPDSGAGGGFQEPLTAPTATTPVDRYTPPPIIYDPVTGTYEPIYEPVPESVPSSETSPSTSTSSPSEPASSSPPTQPAAPTEPAPPPPPPPDEEEEPLTANRIDVLRPRPQRKPQPPPKTKIPLDPNIRAAIAEQQAKAKPRPSGNAKPAPSVPLDPNIRAAIKAGPPASPVHTPPPATSRGQSTPRVQAEHAPAASSRPPAPPPPPPPPSPPRVAHTPAPIERARSTADTGGDAFTRGMVSLAPPPPPPKKAPPPPPSRKPALMPDE